jgi:hypothetical protein
MKSVLKTRVIPQEKRSQRPETGSQNEPDNAERRTGIACFMFNLIDSI